MPITPSPNRSTPLAFHELDAETFERLGVAIMEHEPGVKRADLYGAARDKQFGIDLYGELKSGGLDVASCKCYKKIEKGHISGWSDDFLRHWETHWKNEGIRRFVLMVTAPVNSKEREADIKIEKARFRELGLEYEVWAPSQLENKLRPHPGIVSQYLNPELVQRICGTSTVAPPAMGADSASAKDTATFNRVLVSEITTLQEELAVQVDKQLDVATDGIRRGEVKAVEEQLCALEQGKSWERLNAKTRARVIRLQASLRLQHGEIHRAQELLDRADSIALPDEPRLRALLACRTEGSDKGLTVLGEPTTRDGLHLKIAMLLELGHYDDALALLNQDSRLTTPDPETERLRAFAELLAGRRREAMNAMLRAEQLAPSWPAIRRSGAIIRYNVALSPLSPIDWAMMLNPVDLDLVRDDDEARGYLIEAMRRFDTLANNGLDKTTQEQDRMWALACESNLRNQLTSAEKRCQDVLSKAPANSLAILWALARGYEFDRERSLGAIREAIDRKAADAQQALVGALILGENGKPADAELLLRQTTHLFDNPRAEEILKEHLAELGAQKGDPGANANTPSVKGRRLMQLTQQAKLTNDWGAVETFFSELMNETPPPPVAMAAARVLAQAKRWNAVANHIPGLLQFATSEAVRLAVHATFNANEPRRALELLETHRSAFPGRALPRDLRAIEVQAHHAVGNTVTALQQAASIAVETQDISDEMMLANLRFRTGDIRAAIPAVRRALEENSLDTTQALQLASIVGVEDTDLARQLWRKAVTDGIPRELAPAALNQAFRLGLDHEASHLMEDIHALAQDGSGVVQMMTLEQMIERMREFRAHAGQVERQYSDGVAPVHVLPALAANTFARLYTLPPQNNPFEESGPVFVRHGARLANLGLLPELTTWRIHLDITALLLANQLNLLSRLEALPSPIYISRAAPQALFELQSAITPGQPHRIESLRKVLTAIHRKMLTVIEVVVKNDGPPIRSERALKVLERAIETSPDVIVIAFDQVSQEIPQHRDHFRSMRDVIDALHKAGGIAVDRHARLLEQLGQTAGQQSAIEISVGAKVLFLENTFSVLADNDLTDVLTRYFQIILDPAEIESARAEVEQADRDTNMSSMLGALRQRIADGIARGRYQFIATTVAIDADGDADVLESERPRSSIEQCLIDIITAPTQPGAIACIDDRHVSSYPRNGNGIPIIGTTDVLLALHETAHISKEEYFDAFIRLRAAGAMFIPVEPEEVLHHLSVAPVVNGALSETPALATIRRYMARAALLDNHIKVRNLPPDMTGRPNELPFLLSLRKVTQEVIVALWKLDGFPEASLWAMSNWVWESLRLDYLLHHRTDLAADRDTRTVSLLALQFSRFLIEAITNQSGSNDQRWSTYTRWIWEIVIGPRITKDQALLKKVTEITTGLLVEFIEHSSANQPRYYRAGIRRQIMRLVQRLPHTIRTALYADPRFIKSIGITIRKVLHIAGDSFDPVRWWNAVSDALSYGSTHLRNIHGEKRLIVRRVPGHMHTITIGPRRYRQVLRDPAFALLDRSIARRREVLTSNIDWFDINSAARAVAIDQLVHLPTPMERIDALNQFRKHSVVARYSDLHAQIAAGARIKYRAFDPPSATALLEHLRLVAGNDQTFAQRLNAAADTLITEYGPSGAVTRLWGLPVKLPEPILRAFRALTPDTRSRTLQELLESATTPLERTHVLALLRTVAEDHHRNPMFVELASQAFVVWQAHARLFSTLLKWTDVHFEQDEDWLRCSATDRLVLVWTHADRIASVVLSAGYDADSVDADFRRIRVPRSIANMLLRNGEYEAAAAHPETITPEDLLFHVIAYVAGDERCDEIFTPEVIQTVSPLLQVTVGGATMQSWSLLRNRRAANNDLGSFLTLRPIGLPGIAASDNDAVSEMEGLIGTLEADIASRGAWEYFAALCRPAINADQRPRIDQLARRIDLADISRKNSNDSHLCLVITAALMPFIGDDAKANITRALTALAADLAIRYPGPMPDSLMPESTNLAQRHLSHLLETAALVARASDPLTAVRQLGDILLRYAQAWPAAAPLTRNVLTNVIDQEPVLLGAEVWRSLLSVRTI